MTAFAGVTELLLGQTAVPEGGDEINATCAPPFWD